MAILEVLSMAINRADNDFSAIVSKIKASGR